MIKRIGLTVGLIAPLIILIFADFGENEQTNKMAAIAVMMSVFWVTEAIPLAATALLPLTLFPLLGIASSKATASQYMNSTVFLLIGGFMIALAMQKWNLHKRIALNILGVFGAHPFQLILGFMLATAGLSMWISNTASTLMMLPIALAIISRYEKFLSAEQVHRFTVGLLLSIAYSASIGGMMTLVGTAPNLVFASFYQRINDVSIGFSQWMMLAVPIGMSMLIVLSGMIKLFYLRGLPSVSDLKQVVVEEKKQLGKITNAEKSVLVVFMMTASLWMTRKGIDIGVFNFMGWSHYLSFGKMIDDGSVAIAMATVLFFIPATSENGEKTSILDQTVFPQLPWSIVLLFGGGFALAFGFSESGLSAYLAGQLQGLKSVSLPIIILTVSAGMNLLTELTSNTATTQLVMPILLSTAKVIGISPMWLMLPAVLSASCAFMLPVATPPNAIIFGSGKIKVFEMVKIGIMLNIIGVIMISLTCYWMMPLFIGQMNN
ncbi:MAG: DASS family sodium-coupled anion symporter [Methylococcales bacterium]|nr:DASS family sodium-coupled anion symporter [Methylococcales bacterium]